MKTLKYLSFLISFLPALTTLAQIANSQTTNIPYAVPTLTIEPGIGIHTNFGTDFLFTNLIQWNPLNFLSIVSHSSYNINNITQRKFNGIKTNYNFSINQKIGIGKSFYTKRRSHTFLFMAGVKYTTYKESLDDERFEQASSTIRAFSPDYGLMYSQKKIRNKYFFTYRIYVPLYPWPTKDSDILAIDNNMDNIALEIGIGIKIL